MNDESSQKDDVTTEMLALLHLIEENTRKTKEATRGLGALFIYPLAGLVIGAIFALLGSVVAAGGEASGVGLTIVGVIIAVVLAIAGPVAAFARLEKAK